MNTEPTSAGSEHRRLDYAWLILAVGTLCEFGAVGLGLGYGMLIPAMQASAWA